MPSAHDDETPPAADAGLGLVPASPLRLRVTALPGLWEAWAAALEGVRTPAGPGAERLAALDAAVEEFALAAREQGATVSAILRFLDLVARELAGDAPTTRSRTLRDRAGRVAMLTYYRAGEGG